MIRLIKKSTVSSNKKRKSNEKDKVSFRTVSR